LPPAAFSADPPPPPISPAEAAAAEAVCDYLTHGPAAFYSRLAADAPLRSLAREDALEEIEMRAGEPRRASWVMRTPTRGVSGATFEVVFQSGIDEVVTLEMAERGGVWKIAAVRTLAELTPKQRESWNQPHPADAVAALAHLRAENRRHVAWLAIGSLLVAIIGSAVRHRFRIGSTLALTIAAAGLCLQVAVFFHPRLVPSTSLPMVPQPNMTHGAFAMLRPLLAFRRGMTRGEYLAPARLVDHEVAATEKLWRAEAEGTADEERFGTMLDETPLSALLRARAAADRGHHAQAEESYRAFRKALNGSDAFWLEQAMNEFKIDARGGPLLMFPSRDAGAYYLQSTLDLLGARRNAKDDFRQAWRLQPMTRSDVVQRGLFAPLLRDHEISTLLNLNGPEEPVTGGGELARNPIDVPLSMKASASGMLVRISGDQERLDIPGGAAIAPRLTEAVPATEWKHRDEPAALLPVEVFRKAHITTPGTRARAIRRVETLVQHNRWEDVVHLTDTMMQDPADLPLPLVAQRARALVRAQSWDKVSAMARSPIGKPVEIDELDVPAFVQLADAFVSGGAFASAIDIYQKLGRTSARQRVERRLRRAEARMKFAGSSPLVTTWHFHIHGAPDVSQAVAVRLGQVLEAEVQRILAPLGRLEGGVIRVNMLKSADFPPEATGDADNLGHYDGEISIPCGDIDSFSPAFVAIVTHELAHAIVGQASGGKAPRWLDEGLARHMELVERQGNIFEDRVEVPSIAILDAQLEIESDPLSVSDAGEEAATLIRFLQDRYGPDTIRGLLNLYMSGETSEEAFFLAVTRKSTAEIDREFREWGLSHRTAFVDKSSWPYRRFSSPDSIDPAVREGIHWSKKPAVKP
jgi:hypothetical protein